MYERTSEQIKALMDQSGTIMGTIIGAVIGFFLAAEITGYLSEETIQLAGSVGYYIFKALCEYFGAMLFSQMGRYLGRGLDYGIQKHVTRNLPIDKRFAGPGR